MKAMVFSRSFVGPHQGVPASAWPGWSTPTKANNKINVRNQAQIDLNARGALDWPLAAIKSSEGVGMLFIFGLVADWG